MTFTDWWECVCKHIGNQDDMPDGYIQTFYNAAQLAWQAGAGAERARCWSVAAACAAERQHQLTKQPDHAMPPRDMVAHVIRAKWSEAQRIAEDIAKGRVP